MVYTRSMYCFRRKDLNEVKELLEKEDLELLDYRGYKGSKLYAKSIVGRRGNLEVVFRPLTGTLVAPDWYTDSDISDEERELIKLFNRMYKFPLSRTEVVKCVTVGTALGYLIGLLLPYF